ncbi:MAG: alanine:cation symporter family protein [Chitinispirillaceae bacterium]|nr:alanine:cation symporter family protein [Chitinispirillaceae bacterium]
MEVIALIRQLIITLNEYLWGWPMLALLFGTHLYLTVRLKFPQRYIFKAIKLSISSDADGHGDVSHFGALSTALAATIGTGNIVGVATAITLGGPGALLWMWLTGVFGISTKYSEAVLAIKYRQRTPAGMLGGPMFALERGMNQKWLAILFSVFTALAAFGIGNMVQANSAAVIIKDSFAIDNWISGVCMAVLTGLVIIGGIRSIAGVCTKLVPFMAMLYLAGCVILLGINARYIFPAIWLIITSAFSMKAAAGGLLGAGMMAAIRWGIARGLFSNEAGLGSAPIVAAAARTDNPVRQALVSSSGTFWDTVVICAITGLVMVTSIMKNPMAFEGLAGPHLSAAVFSQIPVIGTGMLSLGLLTFVFSTILGWSYYGERAVQYLFKKKAITGYRVLWVAAVFGGATVKIQLVWDFADVMNALMAIPNLVSLLFLSGVIVAETKKHLWNRSPDTAYEGG